MAGTAEAGIATVTDEDRTREVKVSGAPTLYELRTGPPGPARLTLQIQNGMSAYAFTFG